MHMCVCMHIHMSYVLMTTYAFVLLNVRRHRSSPPGNSSLPASTLPRVPSVPACATTARASTARCVSGSVAHVVAGQYPPLLTEIFSVQ